MKGCQIRAASWACTSSIRWRRCRWWKIISGTATRADVTATAAAFVRRIDKLPLPCRSAPGFLVNRVLIPYMQEGMIAVEEGATCEAVDAAAVRFGMPMGPIELADVVGLDVCKHVGEIIGAAIGRAPPLPLKRLEQLVAERKLGRKSGQGYYRWVDGKAVKMPVDEAAVPAELTDRLMLTLANESVADLARRHRGGCRPGGCGRDLRRWLCPVPGWTPALDRQRGSRAAACTAAAAGSATRVTL